MLTASPMNQYVKLIRAALILSMLCWVGAALAQGQGQATPSPTQAAPSPTQAAPQAAAPTTPAVKLSPEELAQKYVEIWNTGNFDLINSIFKFPAMMTSRGNHVPLNEPLLKRVIMAWRKSMPDLTFKVEDTLVQGNKVALRLSFTGTYKRRLFANTADPNDHPRSIRATAMWMFDTGDGKIKQVWEEYDEIAMHYQMGGFWRTNEDLEAGEKNQAPSAPNSEPAPAAPTPPKP
jgi:predicted ester cyclase